MPFVGGRQCDPLQRCVKNCLQGHTQRHTLRLSHTAEKCLHHAVSPQMAAPQHSSHTQESTPYQSEHTHSHRPYRPLPEEGSKEAEETFPDKTTTLPQHQLASKELVHAVEHLEYSHFPWWRRSPLTPKLSHHKHSGLKITNDIRRYNCITVIYCIYCIRQANLIAHHKYSHSMFIILSLMDHTNTENLSLNGPGPALGYNWQQFWLVGLGTCSGKICI